MLRQFITYLYIAVFSSVILTPFRVSAQINAEQVTRIGQNALYFDDYLLSIQYFNQAISAKPYLARPYFLRAIAKFNLEDYMGAEEDATLAITRNPFLANAYEIRGVARQYMDRPADAVKDFTKALELLPKNRSLMFNKALAEESAGMYAEATETYHELLDAYSHFENGYMGRAKLELSLGDTIKATADLDQALEINKNLLGAYILKAQIAIDRQQDSIGLWAIDNALRLEPQNAGLFINRAYIRYRNGNFNDALADYEHAIAIDPRNKTAYFNRGLLRMEVADNDRALSDFNEVLRLDPDDDRAYYNRAMIYKEKHDYRAAINDLNRVVERYPDFAGARYARFMLYDELGDRRQAMRDYDAAKALWEADKLKPTVTDDDMIAEREEAREQNDFSEQTSTSVAKRFSTLLLTEQEVEVNQEYNNSEIRGRVQDRSLNMAPEPMYMLTYYPADQALEGAAINLREVTDINRSQALRHYLSLALRESTDASSVTPADHHREIDYYNSVVATGGARPIDYLGRAMEEMALYDYDAAVSDLDRAIALSPDFTVAYLLRAAVQHRKAMTTPTPSDQLSATYEADVRLTRQQVNALVYNAIQDLNTIIRINPRNAVAHYNLGCILAEKEEYTDAIDAFNRAIDIEPTMAAAFYNRGYIHLLQGDRERGTADLSRAGQLGIARSYSILKRMNAR